MFSSMPTSNRWTRARRAVGCVAAGMVGLLWSAQSAQANDVYWSIGVHQPGVSVGVSNAPQVIVQPAPRVIYAPPRVVYGAPPVVVYPQPLYRTQWAPPGHSKHWHKGRHGHRHDRRDDRRHDRHDRRDDRWDDRDHRR